MSILNNPVNPVTSRTQVDAPEHYLVELGGVTSAELCHHAGRDFRGIYLIEYDLDAD